VVRAGAGRRLRRQLPYKVESWQETNAQLVSALNAQSVSTGLIRGVVMVVVVLGIASVLVVSVVQKRREIGILRAMGATRGQVLRCFWCRARWWVRWARCWGAAGGGADLGCSPTSCGAPTACRCSITLPPGWRCRWR
jgi:predicted lysophospholipase L1 biosynthesis ABC-type transport system permease subunit